MYNIKEKIIGNGIYGYEVFLPNKMKVILVPRQSFVETHASLIVNYGSMDNIFIDKNENIKYVMEEGIAHFLEHKMFDQKDGTDVFNEFSKLGVYANAYTTYNKTAYTFTATDKISESTKILLDYVQSPYFTEESVIKEKGIIEQEINMIDDDYSYLSYRKVMSLAYKNSPLGKDIAGTKTSINNINSEDLYKCYDYFYSPNNMTFIMCGKFDKDIILKQLFDKYKNSVPSEEKNIEILKYSDKENYDNKYYEKIIDSNTGYISILYKDNSFSNNDKENIFKNIKMDILSDMMFSEFTYTNLFFLEKKLIDNQIDSYISYNKDHGFILYSTTSRKVDDFIYNFKESINKIELDEELFYLLKKKYISQQYRNIIYPSFVISYLTEMNDKDIYINTDEIKEYIEKLSFKEIKDEFLYLRKNIFDNMYISVLKNK